MKKFLLLIAAVMVSVSAFAENWYAGGSFSLWRDGTENETTFTLVPEVGYNLNDRWAIGTGIGYEYLYSDGLHTNAFVFDPYARFTFFKAGPVNFFVDGGFGLALGKSKFKDFSGDTLAVFSVGFKPGIAVNLSEKVALVAHFGFLGYQGTNDAGNTAGYTECGGFRFSGNDLSFGFYYNF